MQCKFNPYFIIIIIHLDEKKVDVKKGVHFNEAKGTKMN